MYAFLHIMADILDFYYFGKYSILNYTTSRSCKINNLQLMLTKIL